MARLRCALLGVLWITFSGLTASAGPQADSAPRFTPPPGEETPEVKVLIDRARSALASGAQGYLEKPCTPDALIEEITKVSRG